MSPEEIFRVLKRLDMKLVAKSSAGDDVDIAEYELRAGGKLRLEIRSHDGKITDPDVRKIRITYRNPAFIGRDSSFISEESVPLALVMAGYTCGLEAMAGDENEHSSFFKPPGS